MRSLLFLLALLPTMLFAKGVEDAKTYHTNSEHQRNIATETIELLPWTGSEKVLDIGCGDGKVTATLSKRVEKGSVLGTDISQAMIDFAVSHYPQKEYPNLSFQRIGAAELPFENCFDRIVSFSTLHWVLNQETALQAIHRALVPGGQICIHNYGKGNMNITEIADALIRTEKWKSHFPSYTKQRVFFTVDEYRALLEKAGFQNIKITGSWSATPLANRQAVTGFSRPLLNFIGHLPENRQQEFTEEVVDKFIAIAGVESDGSTYFRSFNLQVRAEK